MARDDDSLPTQASLFPALFRPDSREAAWRTLAGRYGPLVARWGRARRLQPAAIDDLTQEVLVRLHRALPEFRYDPRRGRFRSYLRTVVENTIRDLRRAEGRRGLPGFGGSAVAEALRRVPASEDRVLAEELSSRVEADDARLRRAVERVKGRVEPHTWRAFWRTEVESAGVAETAEELGLLKGSVHKARSRVRKMLREEFAALEGMAAEEGNDTP